MTIQFLEKSTIHDLLPTRDPNSYKGQNGRLLIIGGSYTYHGAPILNGLAALHSGSDLVFLNVPECNFEVTRNASSNFIVQHFTGNKFTDNTLSEVISCAKTKKDTILIGSGMDETKETITAIATFINQLNKPVVLDAAAIQALHKKHELTMQLPIIITPHLEEFNRLAKTNLTPATPTPDKATTAAKIAKELSITVVLKGAEDIIASPKGEIAVNQTGNAGMTAGGTGDVLAGLIASFISQGLTPFEAAQTATFINGHTADQLAENKGYNFTAEELAKALATTIAKF